MTHPRSVLALVILGVLGVPAISGADEAAVIRHKFWEVYEARRWGTFRDVLPSLTTRSQELWQQLEAAGAQFRDQQEPEESSTAEALPEILEVYVEGEMARVTYRDEESREQTMQLVQEDGDWKIDLSAELAVAAAFAEGFERAMEQQEAAGAEVAGAEGVALTAGEDTAVPEAMVVQMTGAPEPVSGIETAASPDVAGTAGDVGETPRGAISGMVLLPSLAAEGNLHIAFTPLEQFLGDPEGMWHVAVIDMADVTSEVVPYQIHGVPEGRYLGSVTWDIAAPFCEGWSAETHCVGDVGDYVGVSSPVEVQVESASTVVDFSCQNLLP